MMRTAESASAMYGVRFCGWMLSNAGGSTRSRPIANETRLDEKMVALSAESVAANPAIRRSGIPYGTNEPAAWMIPSSPRSPRSSHVGTFAGDPLRFAMSSRCRVTSTPPMAANETRT